MAPTASLFVKGISEREKLIGWSGGIGPSAGEVLGHMVGGSGVKPLLLSPVR